MKFTINNILYCNFKCNFSSVTLSSANHWVSFVGLLHLCILIFGSGLMDPSTARLIIYYITRIAGNFDFHFTYITIMDMWMKFWIKGSISWQSRIGYVLYGMNSILDSTSILHQVNEVHISLIQKLNYLLDHCMGQYPMSTMLSWLWSLGSLRWMGQSRVLTMKVGWTCSSSPCNHHNEEAHKSIQTPSPRQAGLILYRSFGPQLLTTANESACVL